MEETNIICKTICDIKKYDGEWVYIKGKYVPPKEFIGIYQIVLEDKNTVILAPDSEFSVITQENYLFMKGEQVIAKGQISLEKLPKDVKIKSKLIGSMPIPYLFHLRLIKKYY